ncbi:MAG: HigA family addiction module antitoxin [Alphaproteobacteria bacterium]
MGKKPEAKVIGVDASTVHSWLAKDEVVLVDVRETSEYDREHIPGSMLLPMSSFDSELFPKFTDKKVVLHCAVGKRSEAAGKMLVNEGYEGAIHMTGGIREWKAAGYATEVQYIPPPIPADDASGAAAEDAQEAVALISQPPGEVLVEEFMEPLGIGQGELAADISVTEEVINAIIENKMAVTVELSLRLARYFSTASDFWLHVQMEHDLEKVRRDIGVQIRQQVTPRTAKK